jgi:hypothetical protein
MAIVAQHPVSFNAEFDGQHGIALRDEHNAVWFIADDGALTLLHNADAPYLTLFGRTDIAAEQKMLDGLHGGLYQLIDHRNSHRPLAA